MAVVDKPTVASFKGLNTTTDALRLGMEWLTKADNVNINDTGGMDARKGWSLATAGTNITGAYTTEDFSRFYIVDAGALKSIVPGVSAVTLRSGLNTAPMSFTEVNGQVYFTNGIDSGIITADNEVMPWAWSVPDAPRLAAVSGSLPAGRYQVRCTFTLPDGRMTGPSESSELVLTDGQALQISAIPQLAGGRTNLFIAPADSTVYGLADRRAPAAMVWNSRAKDLGIELMRPFCAPLPAGVGEIQHWKGRMYAAQYLPTADASIIWYSQPMGFHQFDTENGFFVVPGKALMLAPHATALIVGTEREVYAYNADGLPRLAPYGVVPGRTWSEDDPVQGAKRILFWTTRGVCAALPFVNLTEQQVSVAPGVRAGGAIVRDDGQKRYVVALQRGGSAFNSLR